MRTSAMRWKRLLVLISGLFVCFMFIISSKQRTEDSSKNEDLVENILNAIQSPTRSVVLPDEETVLVQPWESKSCQDSGNKQFLLLMLISSPENVERRQVLRDIWKGQISTWEKNVAKYVPNFEKGSAIKALFFVGQSPVASLKDLSLEAEEHGDMIIDDFTESYLNLTIKTLRMLKWVDRHCGNVRYLLKIDDDVYLNAPVLIDFLHNLNDSAGQNLIAGHKYAKITIDSDPKSKWYTPNFLWITKRFPDFVSGVSYVLGSTARAQLYQSALETQLFHLEDVFLTGIVRKKHLSLDVVDIPKVYTMWTFAHKFTSPCTFVKSVVAVHSLSAEEVKCYNNMMDYCQNWPLIPVVFLC